jgi:hypothetical protein
MRFLFFGRHVFAFFDDARRCLLRAFPAMIKARVTTGFEKRGIE